MGKQHLRSLRDAKLIDCVENGLGHADLSGFDRFRLITKKICKSNPNPFSDRNPGPKFSQQQTSIAPQVLGSIPSAPPPPDVRCQWIKF